MSLRSSARRAGLVLLALLCVTSLATCSAQAAERPSPGSITGFAFDACTAPTQAQMDAWRVSSPFWGVGVYIGGANRLCDQPNLDSTWVLTQSRRGWRVLPIWVGPQASCAPYKTVIDDTPASRYLAARRQGRREADRAVQTAQDLGFAKHSTLWYDLENFDLSGTDCRRSALSFLSAWTKRLHHLGFTSGVYANVAAVISALDYAAEVSPGSYAQPDQIWYAWHNGRANTRIKRRWVRPGSWSPHRRIHQYRLDQWASYGGVRLRIDRSFMDVGRGSVAPSPRRTCGVRVDFPSYRRLVRGARGGQVRAAQCLLRRHGFAVGPITGRFSPRTVRATRAFQRSRHLRVTGTMTLGTWTVLLSAGRSPVLKRGSADDAVRRLQRALNAADGAGLAVTGVFDLATTRAVSGYQRSLGMVATGVVAGDTWPQLHAGAR